MAYLEIAERLRSFVVPSDFIEIIVNVEWKHPTSWEGAEGITQFRVRQDAGSNMFYANAPKFGCGRNASNPMRAIESLVHSQACRIVDLHAVNIHNFSE